MMKKLYLLVILIACASCERDFDEWNDTDQRSVTIFVRVDDFFDSILLLNNNSYCLGTDRLPNKHCRIRITTNCYDMDGSLVERLTGYASGDTQALKATVKHLKKNQHYVFIIVADIVEYHTKDLYNEHWYHIGYNDLFTYQLASFQHSDTSSYNLVKSALFYVLPNNQDTTIRLTQLTFNGYIEFQNTQNVKKISGWTKHCCEILLCTKKWLTRSVFNYTIHPNNSESVILPITCNITDTTFQLNTKIFSTSGNNESTITIQNTELRPFVVKYNVSNNEYQCTYY